MGMWRHMGGVGHEMYGMHADDGSVAMGIAALTVVTFGISSTLSPAAKAGSSLQTSSFSCGIHLQSEVILAAVLICPSFHPGIPAMQVSVMNTRPSNAALLIITHSFFPSSAPIPSLPDQQEPDRLLPNARPVAPPKPSIAFSSHHTSQPSFSHPHLRPSSTPEQP